mmetsp:Transcript_5560/g.17539  ORF Transcript_5560/g.17539 Transcript_5560/m.17539 type:complete len:301 (+) Transcript_5560:1742-2644(+)
MTYCSYGQKDSRLGAGAFLRLMKESKNVMIPCENGVAPSDVELTFMKHRNSSKVSHSAVESHLRYVEFLGAIEHLADIYFLLAPPTVGKLVKDDAKKCHFLRRHLFQSKVAQYHTTSLCSSSCVGRADARLLGTMQKIISSWRIYDSRKVLNLRRRGYISSQIERRGKIASTVIQRVWRGAIGRSVASCVARGVYDLFVDSSTGREFWFNRQTRLSSWVRPSLLLRCEIRNPIFMPCSELVFEAICALCSQTPAERYCIDCKHLLCDKCDLVSHSNNSESHNSVKINFCAHCHFQPGALD